MMGGFLSYWFGLRQQKAEAKYYEDLSRRVWTSLRVEQMLNNWQGKRNE